MRIEAATKYRCDGCGVEAINPTAWYSVMPMMFSGAVFNTVHVPSSDYCSTCVQRMRAALATDDATS